MKTKKLLSLLIAVVLVFSYNTNVVFAEESITTGSTVQSINANNLVWEAPTESNPFGGAKNFNGVIFGEISGLADSEGPVAGNGNIIGCQAIATEQGVLYGSHTQYWVPADGIDTGISPKINIGLLLGGKASTSAPIKNGDIVLGTNASYTGGSPLRRAEVDAYLTSAKADLIAMSSKLFAYEANGTIDNTGADKIIFTGTNTGTNVFEIDFSKTQFPNKQVIFNIPDGATVLINVIGSGEITIHSGTNVTHATPYQNTPTLNGKASTAEFAGRILYNYDSRITRINSKAGTNYILGSMLAPNAEVHGEKGDSSINGTLVANKISGTGGGFELHYFPFRGGFTDPSEKTGNFEFVKYAKTINQTLKAETLAGATFALMQGTEEKYTETSGADGKVSFTNIPIGSYTLIEKTAPTGYTKSETSVVVVVGTDGSVTADGTAWASAVATVEGYFENAKTPDPTGNFSFIKYTDKSETLAGAVFALTQGTEEKYTETSGADGKVSFTNIPIGTYTLIEKTAPTGYTKSETSVTVIVGTDGSVTADGTAWASAVATVQNGFVNTRINLPGSFSFVKYSTDKIAGLQGAEFTLTNNSVVTGEQVSYTVNSIDGGIVSFTNIPTGIYTLTETKAPTGYELAKGKSVTVSISTEGVVTIGTTPWLDLINETQEKFENAPILGGFEFTKFSTTGEALQGATFALMQGQVEIATATSASAGTVSFTNIPTGAYTLIEKTAPTGYTKSNKSATVTINSDGTVVFDKASSEKAFENAPIPDVPGQFSFTKYSVVGETKLEGAVFALTQGTEEKYTATSGALGAVSFTNIPAGEYTLTEKTPPTGYTKSNANVTIVVAKNGDVTVGTNTWATATPSIEDGFKNIPVVVNVLGKFEFTKYTTTQGQTLAGAVFALTQGTEEKYTATSVANGLVSFSNIESGTYELKEITAPTGYVKSEQTISVTINSDGTSNFNTTDAETKFVNAPVIVITPGQFSFTKYSVVGETKLEGAVFALTQGTEEKYTATSDTMGSVSFSNIASGTYTLSEKTPPTGYTKSNATVMVFVGTDGDVFVDDFSWGSRFEEIERDFVNTPIQVNVQGFFNFTKYSVTEQTLQGAVFALTQGTTEITATSDETGVVSFGNIPSGTYTLAEKTAPTGYTESNATFTVVVANDGAVTVNGTPWADQVSTIESDFMNTPTIVDIPGQFSFTKYTTAGAKLQGAVFELLRDRIEYAAAAAQVKDAAENYTATSDINGIVLFTNIPSGFYILTETKAPTGYTKSNATVRVYIAENGKVYVGDFSWAERVNSIENDFKNAPTTPPNPPIYPPVTPPTPPVNPPTPPVEEIVDDETPLSDGGQTTTATKSPQTSDEMNYGYAMLLASLCLAVLIRKPKKKAE